MELNLYAELGMLYVKLRIMEERMKMLSKQQANNNITPPPPIVPDKPVERLDNGEPLNKRSD